MAAEVPAAAKMDIDSAVSITDYQNFAQAFAGIAKAYAIRGIFP